MNLDLATLTPPPETLQLKQRSADLEQRIKALSIQSDMDLVEAGALAKVIAEIDAEIERVLGPFSNQLYKLHRQSVALIASFRNPLQVLRGQINTQVKAYHLRLEEARMKAERERRAAEAKARQEADEAERKAKAEAESKRQQEAKLLAEAEAALKRGDEKAADILIGESIALDQEAKTLEQAKPVPVAVSAPLPPPPAPRAADVGIGMTKYWTWECTDLAQVPREFLVLDTRLIDAIVQKKKGETNIAGIRVFQDSRVRRG